jgi:iron complex outermembrane recepter protein
MQLNGFMWLALMSTMGGAGNTYSAMEDDVSLEIEEVVTIGSRMPERSAADSPVPVDVISGKDFENQAGGDMDTLLRALVPSFSVDQQPLSDAATMVRPANLRGLAPDHILVLVNGKRRHRSSVIAFDGSGVSDGAQGPDIGPIPTIALKRVEVLRDGAAAQYGSDAIAGVINFALKDNREGGSIEVRYGQTYEGDGDTTKIAGNLGLPLSDEGFFNISAEYSYADPTSRTRQHTEAQIMSAAGNTYINDPAMIWGAPDVDDDTKLFFNSAVSLSDTLEMYSFGNFARKEVDGSFFFRAPATRGGVYTSDEGKTLLVGDLNPDNDIICPVVPIDQATLTPDADLLAQISDNNTAIGRECFAFSETHPGGFAPRFGGFQTDYSFYAGARGEFNNGLIYDVSASLGSSGSDFRIRNTVNASLGPDSPTEFKPGEHIQTEQNFNIDLVYSLDVAALQSPLNIASGFEWREEEFEVKLGDPDSFATGELAKQGFSSGSNGFSGFSPEQAGVFSRSNIAIYTDFEAEITEKLLLALAVRWEDFEDFGKTTNWKLAGHYALTDRFALRASASTGFRAPTPGQANIVNISTLIQTIDGKPTLVNEGTIPPTNPVAMAKGGKELAPEESVNYSLGAVFSMGDLDVTVDYFNIEITDRIALGADITLTPEEIIELKNAGITGAESLGTFKFYTNNFDTTTQGIDLIATYNIEWERSNTDFIFSFNWTDTNLDDSEDFIKSDGEVIEIVDDLREAQLEEQIPNIRYSLGATHFINQWRITARVNYFDSWRDPELTEDQYGDEYVVDIEAGYQVNDNLTLILGAQNVFDEYPDKSNAADGFTGNDYPERSPFGFNGGVYYARLKYEF